MKKILLLLAVAASLISTPAVAKKESANDYNYKKAYEALKENADEKKALELLGQSVMERFGTITIDNINSKLVIKQ